jgi:hypothetical protein
VQTEFKAVVNTAEGQLLVGAGAIETTVLNVMGTMPSVLIIPNIAAITVKPPGYCAPPCAL